MNYFITEIFVWSVFFRNRLRPQLTDTARVLADVAK